MLGGEPSGHIIFRGLGSTGDGLLTALQILHRMKRTGQTLSALAAVVPHVPQVSIQVPASEDAKRAFRTAETVQRTIALAQEALGAQGRVVVRPSGTEPVIRIMVEGTDRAQIERQAEALARVIREEL
jgi:phosphoglucosamine mutase